jgi:hypothetical protein
MKIACDVCGGKYKSGVGIAVHKRLAHGERSNGIQVRPHPEPLKLNDELLTIAKMEQLFSQLDLNARTFVLSRLTEFES